MTGSAKREEFAVASLAPPISHYCDAVRFGDLLFIRAGRGRRQGQGRRRRRCGAPDLRKHEEGARRRRRAFRRRAEGDRVHDQHRRRPLINPVRQEFFGPARPASTLVEVRRLVRPDLLLEIEAVVGLPQR